MIELRPYQSLLIERVRDAYLSGYRAPLVVAPTGAGKTILFSAFTKAIIAKGNRAIILAHRQELIDQISSALGKFGIRHARIQANEPMLPADVHVASVFTAARRKLPHYDIVITDEAHHQIKGSTWDRVTEMVRPKWQLGVTATPCRLSGEPLGDIFDTLVLGPSTRELIDQGYLSKYRIFAPGSPNTSHLHTRGGDFVTSEAESLMDRPQITGSAINEYKKHSDGKRAIVFCTTIKHAQNVRDQFKAAGYRSDVIDGTIDSQHRQILVAQFSSGFIQVLTSVGVVSEGFDLPAIETAILLRPTQSVSLYLQQVGRALRPYPGKEHAIILDHAGNVARHGFPCADREWSLTHKIEPVKKSEGGSTSVRICERCFFAQSSLLKTCGSCGYEFPIKEREINEVDGDLKELMIEQQKVKAKQEQARAQTLEELVSLGKARGYKNAYSWAVYVYNGRRMRGGRR